MRQSRNRWPVGADSNIGYYKKYLGTSEYLSLSVAPSAQAALQLIHKRLTAIPTYGYPALPTTVVVSVVREPWER